MHYIKVNKLITKSIYKQIAESITEAIDQGILVYNDKLPTEKEICQTYSISQTAVKMAYELLIQEHKIKRIKGKGTYVTNRSSYHTDMHSFYEIEYKNTVKRHIVLLEKSNKDIAAMRELKLSSKEKYYSIVSLFEEDGNPALLQRAFLPMHQFKKLDEIIQHSRNVYQLLEELYGYQIVEFRSTFNPLNVNPSDALLLRLEPDDAVYLVRTKIMGLNNQVLAYVCNYYPGEFTEFEVIVYAK